ncbi:MAG: RNA ligase family protein [Chlamydiales bacterium]|nr:RNA ligase family protein [Chlamydiales bacterium]
MMKDKLIAVYLTLSSIPPGSRFDAFLQAANAYPQGDAHSFAFYLANHVGDTWLPFPFLEILRKLHQGYVLRKKRSELQHLIRLI